MAARCWTAATPRDRANLLSRGGPGAGLAWADWALQGPWWANATRRIALARRLGAPVCAPGLQCAREYVEGEEACGA
eukprot:11200899-Lingulodinium_polyedra.AAC.1